MRRTQNAEPAVPVADVCLLLEGTWPYVRGGVSSWINQMILGLPDVTFSVLFIGGQRDAYPRRNYEIPPNVVHIAQSDPESISGWKFLDVDLEKMLLGLSPEYQSLGQSAFSGIIHPEQLPGMALWRAFWRN